jgi:hypothetical protein
LTETKWVSRRFFFPPFGKGPLMSTARRQRMHQDLQLAGLAEGT